MPEEILAIVIISIVMGSILSIVRMSLAYKERMRGAPKRSSSGDSSLTTSELETMVNRAMRRAVKPLERRLAGIEDHLGSSALLPEADRAHRLEDKYLEDADLEDRDLEDRRIEVDTEEAIGAARTSRSRRRS